MMSTSIFKVLLRTWVRCWVKLAFSSRKIGLLSRSVSALDAQDQMRQSSTNTYFEELINVCHDFRFMLWGFGEKSKTFAFQTTAGTCRRVAKPQAQSPRSRARLPGLPQNARSSKTELNRQSLRESPTTRLCLHSE